MTERPRPAWSAAFAVDALRKVDPIPSIDEITPDWAWGGSTGAGVKVAVIDSGIEADHPAIAGAVSSYVAITEGPDGLIFDEAPHTDAYGHGTACAGIIRSIAPDCELHSVQVLGPRLTGRGVVFAAGLRWAIERGMSICNLSLGTTKRDFFGIFHELADLAYFRNAILVTAANNMPMPSFPSLYASVISVACHDGMEADVFYYNPEPPVEFGAPGIDVRVAWRDGAWITATGNSFAAPHISGLVTRILGKHPELTPFHVKTVLRALASNVPVNEPHGIRALIEMAPVLGSPPSVLGRRAGRVVACGGVYRRSRGRDNRRTLPALVIKNGLLAGRRLQVTEELVIGRTAADVTIDDERVSRRHAIIRAAGESLTVEDLGSLNGTWVNGTRIETATRLERGDIVEVGRR